MPVILILIGFIFIVYSYISMKKEKNLDINDDKKEDNSFKSILRNNERDLSDYKFELGVLRKDIGESLNELQQEILEIKKALNLFNEKDLINEDRYDTKVHNSINENYYKESSKASNIRELLKDGLTDEEISEKLSVTKGEILLVKGLYKQQ
ncbi:MULTISPECIES: hypothetical protein [Clostridium]|uniref:Uncharacterized protein n=1 Tax=Clostridium neonatale TaxID=137838 RepID=A0A650MRZ4_9CLOT|nr:MULTISPECIES: hypothetical protein [Clostridium]MBP8313066.1 hypothetical protein [Clostridium neonatale]MBS4780814.1 hypothetical protein [Clostridium sp.]CAG9705315.1 conserved hypothetical protein [Clostridium neonatale]CAI3535080.1 conserved hypothetical protein [Clostridium neonatale]CAI3541241.1 conserved hypothetical protein [Clostridium neonatale]